jgi:hypothetical protein
MRSEAELFNADVLHGIYSDADWLNIEKSLGFTINAPLRETLQNLASYYAALAQLKPVPPSKQADGWQKEESRFEAAREALSDIGTATPAALTARIAWALGQRKRLEAHGGRIGNKNAKRLHRKFWGELLGIWRTLPIASERRTHASLRAFLFACSAPIFPANTARGALTAFTKDHFKPRPRQ